jgi:hypothetical protein
VFVRRKQWIVVSAKRCSSAAATLLQLLVGFIFCGYFRKVRIVPFVPATETICIVPLSDWCVCDLQHYAESNEGTWFQLKFPY